MELRRQSLTRYIQPLREGGSLPALAEADDDFRYVLKFKGGGHGSKPLISELIGGEIIRAAGLNVPELVFLDVDERFGITEADEEIQDLLKASRGLNLGLHYLAGSVTLDPWVNPVDDMLASKIVWLDAFLMNVDRTAKNTNMLVWNHEPWLIDQGASLYFHHNWPDRFRAVESPFQYIRDHALIRKASLLREADVQLRHQLTPGVIADIIDMVPDEWLQWEGSDQSPDQIRSDYREILVRRLEAADIFLNQAIEAHHAATI